MIPSSYQPIGSDSPVEDERGLVQDQDIDNSQQPTWRKAVKKLQKADQSFVVSKSFYFFFYTALGALFPFFSLFYKQLWLSPGQIGVVLALRPIVKLVCLPLWKMVTDRYSKTKVVYFISSLGWLIGYFGQSFVYPNNMPCYGYATTVVPSQSSGIDTLYPTSNSSHVNSSAQSFNNFSTRELNLDPKMSVPLHIWDPRNLKSSGKATTTEERLSKNLSSTKHPSVSNEDGAPFLTRSRMAGHGVNDQGINSKSRTDKLHQQDGSRFPLGERNSEYEASYTSSSDDKRQDNSLLSETESKTRKRTDPQEQQIINKKKVPGMEPFQSSEKMVESPKPSYDFRVQYNFWVFRTLVVIVVLTEIITTPTPMLADNAIVQALVETDSEYGKQRLFGSLGLSLAAILVAVWVSAITDCVYTDTINYLPCFYVFEIALGATILVSLFVKFDRPLDEQRSQYRFLEGLKLFNRFNNAVFLVTLFFFGYLHSLQSSFLFWYLQDLGGTPVLFSIILLIYCLAEVVMYFLSSHVVEAIGQQGMICLASACYTARFLMYAYLKDPWLVLPMEIVQGVTYGGVWSIAVVYINAPPGMLPALRAVLRHRRNCDRRSA